MAQPPGAQSLGSATGNPRNKVALKPGRSLMDWIRLGQSGKDLTGVNGKLTKVTFAQLMAHNTLDDAWLCVKGKVYNVTHYLEFHPGGADELMRGVGGDATSLFNEIHQWVNADSMLQKCLVGYFDSSNSTSSSLTVMNSPTSMHLPSHSEFKNESFQSRPPSLIVPSSPIVRKSLNVSYGAQVKEVNKESFQLIVPVTQENRELESSTLTQGNVEETIYYRLLLQSKHLVNHNTRIFCFKFKDKTKKLLVPIGHHVHFKVLIEGMEIMRSYTPIWRDINTEDPEKESEVIFMIKIYQNGAITSILENLNLGDYLEMSESRGTFSSDMLDLSHNLVLIAAGTGFTPMVKIIHWALFKTENRHVNLLFFNREEKDILWKNVLDSLAEKNPRFAVTYILSEPDSQWAGPIGRIRQNILEENLPPKGALCFTCGPAPFIATTLQILDKLKVPSSHIHAFTA